MRPLATLSRPRPKWVGYQHPISWELFWYHEVGELVFPASADGWTKTKALCQYHADKRPGTFSVNILHGRFRCWSCQETGSAARYAKEKYNLTWPKAYRYVEERG